MAKGQENSDSEMIDLGQAEELRVPKTAELVANRVRKRIIAGDLKEGDSLPPEGQLMEQFGISRPTLREAFRILEAERLIAVSRGSRTGARVSLPQVSSVSRYASFVLQANAVRVPDIFEARLAIELFAVRRISRNPRPERIMRLREEIRRLDQSLNAGVTRSFILGLTEFHQLLVDVSGNRTLLFVIQMLQDLMQEAQLRLMSGDGQGDVEAASKAVRSMGKLVDLIEAGEAEEAARHWRLHLTNANKKIHYEGTLRDLLKR